MKTYSTDYARRLKKAGDPDEAFYRAEIARLRELVEEAAKWENPDDNKYVADFINRARMAVLELRSVLREQEHRPRRPCRHAQRGNRMKDEPENLDGESQVHGPAPINCPACMVLIGQFAADVFEHMRRDHHLTERESREVAKQYDEEVKP